MCLEFVDIDIIIICAFIACTYHHFFIIFSMVCLQVWYNIEVMIIVCTYSVLVSKGKSDEIYK